MKDIKTESTENTKWKRELDENGSPINVQYNKDGNRVAVEVPDFIEVTDFEKLEDADHVKNMETMQKTMRNVFTQTYCIEIEVLEGGHLPFKKNPKDAGFDLIATEDLELRPGEVAKMPLNIKMKLPEGSWGRIESKSGLGAKGLLVYAGVIDEEYRGVPHVVMSNINHGAKEPIFIKKNQKLAQMTMNPHSTHFYIKQVDSVDTDTARGEGGFGSQGT